MVLVLKNEDRPAVELRWVNPPRQIRSQQTLERLLDAAEQLILEKGPEGASVSGVAKRAKSSVGAFYARFDDKDSLLRSVYERFLDQANATIDHALRPENWAGQDLEVVLGTAMRFLMQITDEKRHLLGGLVLHAHRDDGLAVKIDGLIQHLANSMAELLVDRGDVEKSAEARVCVMGMAGLALSVVQGTALRNPNVPPPMPREVMAEQLKTMCMAYLAGINATRRQ